MRKCIVCGFMQAQKAGNIVQRSAAVRIVTVDEAAEMMGSSLQLGDEAGLDPRDQIEAGERHQERLEQTRKEITGTPLDRPRLPGGKVKPWSFAEITREADRQAAIIRRKGGTPIAVTLNTAAHDVLADYYRQISSPNTLEQWKTGTVGHMTVGLGDVVKVYVSDDPDKSGDGVMLWAHVPGEAIPPGAEANAVLGNDRPSFSIPGHDSADDGAVD